MTLRQLLDELNRLDANLDTPVWIFALDPYDCVVEEVTRVRLDRFGPVGEPVVAIYANSEMNP